MRRSLTPAERILAYQEIIDRPRARTVTPRIAAIIENEASDRISYYSKVTDVDPPLPPLVFHLANDPNEVIEMISKTVHRSNQIADLIEKDNRWLPLKPIYGFVDHETYLEMEHLHDLNQLYLLEMLTEDKLGEEELKILAADLENWFAAILSNNVVQDDEWYRQEVLTKFSGYNWQTIPEIRALAGPFSPQFITWLKECYATTNIIVI